jgi:hypothetical protein
MMRRSAPPMPRSGWRKIMFLGLGFEGAIVEGCC